MIEARHSGLLRAGMNQNAVSVQKLKTIPQQDRGSSRGQAGSAITEVQKSVGRQGDRNSKQGRGRELFPLSLSSIERLHLHDDWPEFPNQIFARLRLQGELQPDLARAALQQATQRHAWHQAVARRSPSGRWMWEQDSSSQPELVWSEVEPCRFEQLDLTRGPVCRLVGRRLPGGCELTFQVHHAVVDGLGGLQFVRDWLVIYDNLVAGREPEQGLGELELDMLRQRNRLGLLQPKYLLNFWRQAIGLFGASKFLFRRFATIAGNEPLGAGAVPPADEAWPHYAAVAWAEEELAAVRATLRRTGVALNDWLLAALFHTLDQWHREQFGAELSGWSRLIVPISLRTAEDRRMPAANRASLVQLDRRPQTEPDQMGLARGISYELGLIRRWQLDRMFLVLVRGMSISDAWLRSAVGRRQARATSMLTNLGKPLLRLGLPLEGGRVLAGGLRLEELDVVGPIRFGMPLSFAVAEYGGQLRLTAHYDSRRLRKEQVEPLLRTLRERVLHSPGQVAGKVSPN